MKGLDHATGTSLSDYRQWPRGAAFPPLSVPPQSFRITMEPLRIGFAAAGAFAGGDADPSSDQRPGDRAVYCGAFAGIVGGQGAFLRRAGEQTGLWRPSLDDFQPRALHAC